MFLLSEAGLIRIKRWLVTGRFAVRTHKAERQPKLPFYVRYKMTSGQRCLLRSLAIAASWATATASSA